MNIKYGPIVIVLSATFLSLSGCNTSLQKPDSQGSTPVGSSGGIPSIPPAGSSGSGSETGSPAGSPVGGMGMGGSAGSGQDPGTVAGTGDSGSVGGQGTGSGGLDEDFDKSLGDFDKQMGREQAGVQGSSGAAERREDADEKSVRTASMKGGSIGGIGSAGGMSGSSSGGGKSGNAQGQSGEGQSGSGQSGEGEGEGTSDDGSGGGTEGAGSSDPGEEQVAELPKDITVDESAEDQVGRQIREAAMAEKDPVIRDALWDEYRKHMGLK